ncbi:plasmid stabilization protein [Streptomyces nanshensis]|nr:plasmid stabilization protein [Streptomyces nanshensis]
MIVLDTDVLSELTRRSPEPGVVEWLDSLPSAEVATTAITAAELLHGVGRLPSGHRRTALSHAVNTLLNQVLEGRVLPFDFSAAERYAQIVTAREQLGRPVGVADAQIAAVCRARGATLATRNTKDFTDTGVELVDPWQSP